MNANDTKLSKSLSWLLRHGAMSEGLSFDSGGFIDVKQIFKLKQFKNYNESDVIRVVESNDKKRFSIRYGRSDNVLQIRANQGHSLQVAESELLTLLTENTLVSPIYHGTYFQNVSSIKAEGLNRMRRNHIHFTSKFPGVAGVVSGMRHNSEVFIVVDSTKALADGFKFYQSENEVILCPGNEDGFLPAVYIKEIWQISPFKRLN